MKPLRSLTRRGHLRRYRAHAEIALQAYGLMGAPLKLLQYGENAIYRVDAPDSTLPVCDDSFYQPGRYVLRSHAMGDLDVIASEMVFLKALSEEASLPVPAPVPTLDGELVIKVTTPGVPKGRAVSLMHWLVGRRLKQGLSITQFKSWGQLVARMHKFSQKWKPPADFIRPTWDWDAQLGGSEFKQPLEEIIASMPESIQAPYQEISDQARELMRSLGTDSDAFGIIHSDMYKENILFARGEARPIDFEDCGFGYWIWDIAVALSEWAWKPGWEMFRDSFLEGYFAIHSLDTRQINELDRFIGIHHATMVLWSSVFILNFPGRINEYEPWRTRECEELVRYIRNRK